MKRTLKAIVMFIVMLSFIGVVSSVNAMSKSEFVSYLNSKFPNEGSLIKTVEEIVESKNIPDNTLTQVANNIDSIASKIGGNRDINSIKNMSEVTNLAKSTANLLGLTIKITDDNSIVVADGSKTIGTITSKDLESLYVDTNVNATNYKKDIVNTNSTINKNDTPKTGVSYVNIIIAVSVIVIAALGIIILAKKK